jgi:hypothetical protein
MQLQRLDIVVIMNRQTESSDSFALTGSDENKI